MKANEEDRAKSSKSFEEGVRGRCFSSEKLLPRERSLGPLVAVLWLIVAAIVCASRFSVTTEITRFLPSGTDRRLAPISAALADSELTRTVILTVGGPTESEAASAASELAARLRRSPEVTWVQSGVRDDVQQAVYELYFPRRLAFLSDEPETDLPRRLSDGGLADSARELERQLTLPTAPLVRSIAPADPLLAFPAVLERLEQARSRTLDLRDGQLVTASGGRGVVLLGTRARAFEAEGQRRFQAELGAMFSAVDRAHHGALDLLQSGMGRFATAAEASIRADITRISVLSTLAVVLLYLLLFRSLRALGVVMVLLAGALVSAAAVGLLVFGRLHGLTLAFGSTLIGVCMDYAVHLQAHHALSPCPDGPRHTVRRIWPALVLGAVTTAGGFAGLAWTELPGMREIAVFASVGVFAALLLTRMLLPSLLPRTGSAPTQLRCLASRIGLVLAWLHRHPRLAAVTPIVALAAGAAALPQARWDDDISNLQVRDPALLAEEDRVREQVAHVETSRFVIALGTDDEDALRVNDRVFLELQDARHDGLLDEHRSLHMLLWSADLQRRNLAAVEGSARLAERTLAALGAGGFRPEAFEPFRRALADPPPEPLRWDDLARSPLADVVRPFHVTLDAAVEGDVPGGVAVLTYLRGVRDARSLATRVERIDGAVFFDQFAFMGDAYARYRRRTVELVLMGFVVIMLIVLGRYRRPGLMVAALAPAVVAAVTTLGLIVALGFTLNLLHLVGLLLVLSMGVDYGVFFVESRGSPEDLTASGASVLVACITTVTSFGLLALSSNPAIRAVGLTTGIGVLLALVFAPVVLVCATGRRPDIGTSGAPVPPCSLRT
jgi:predicted exporter